MRYPRKRLKKIIPIVAVLCAAAILLNFRAATRQGINYSVRTVRIPLYLKLFDFFDRHYNYRFLVGEITGDTAGAKEKAMKIFAWTYANIRRQPDSLPVIDDHVWHIIIRGYGVADQFSDAFTTLCNYAGMDAFFRQAYNNDRSLRLPLSFIKINDGWHIFDPYRGAYFENKSGVLATIDDLKKGHYSVRYLAGSDNDAVDYEGFLGNLPEISGTGLRRANIQSPLKRFIYEIKMKLKR